MQLQYNANVEVIISSVLISDRIDTSYGIETAGILHCAVLFGE